MIGDICTVDWLGRRLYRRTSAESKSITETGSAVTEDEFKSILVLDCRSPEEYAACHVIGSLCVVVPTIVLRRLLRGSGSFPVSTANAIGVIGAGEAPLSAKDIEEGNSDCGMFGILDHCRRADVVVLYDDVGLDTSSGGKTVAGVRSPNQRSSSSAYVVDLLVGRLSADRCLVSRLEGGFKAFKTHFNHLCTGSSCLTDQQFSSSPVRSNLALRLQSPSSVAPLLTSSPRPSSECVSSSDVDASCISGSTTHEHVHDLSDYQSQQPFPVEVLPYLFLGDAENSQDFDCLCRHNIRYVINVTPNVPNTFIDHPGFRYLRIPIDDHWSENVTSSLSKAFAFIEEARSKKSGVLVHCLAGISRSVTVTIAYLMTTTRMSLNDAYEYLRHYRPNIAPNLSFMGQLLDLERDLVANSPSNNDSFDAYATRVCVQSSLAIDAAAIAERIPENDSLDIASWAKLSIELPPVKSLKESAGPVQSVGLHCRHITPVVPASIA